MKLIFIYGAPATGKYTIAKELQSLTKFPLLHNHLTSDLASSVYECGTEEYSALSYKLRLTIIDEYIKSGVNGLIMTYAYGLETYHGRDDDDFIRQIIEKNKGGKTIFVKLECPQEEQLKRVASKSRKEFGKITDPKLLQSIQSEYETNKTIPFVESMIINTNTLSPNESAKQIAERI